MTARQPLASYDPARTVVGGVQAEIGRLERQADLTWPAERRIFAELGLSEARTLLEIGCGSGAVTQRLRTQFPACRLVAVDPDLRLLVHAPAGVRSVAARVERLPLRSGSTDAALARHVFQHLSDPRAALDEVRRVLRGGGRLVVVDVDAQLWGFAAPQFVGPERVYRKVAEAQRRRGGDRSVVRDLPRMLESVGFVDVTVRPYAVSSGEQPLSAFADHLGPDRLLPLVDSGELSLTDYADVAAAWQRFAADPHPWVTLLGFVVSARLEGSAARWPD